VFNLARRSRKLEVMLHYHSCFNVGRWRPVCAWRVIVLLLGAQTIVTLANAQPRPAVELEGAIAKEQVDGDLKAAITTYQRIAANTTAPRAVRAKALLHLARSYERLGQQAQNIYRQIVRDFGDQPAAAQARTRLVALQQASGSTAVAGMNQHRISVLENLNLGVYPSESTDGRRGVYRNDATGELIFGSLDGRSKRVIYRGRPADEPRWNPSRDFSRVALQVSVNPEQPQTLAIVHTDGTGYRELTKLEQNRSAYGLTWSWDNRYLLVSGFQFDPGRMLTISVADGKVRELSNVKTPVRSARFSPDGNFIAYHDLGNRLYIMPVAGGQPQVLYEGPTGTREIKPQTLFDWTLDGRYLVIAHERAGKAALQILPVRNGKVTGPSVFVMYGDLLSARTTATGELIYSVLRPGGIWTVHLASLGSNGLLSAWKHLDLQLGNIFSPSPSFSADGTQIVYSATREDAGQSLGSGVRVLNLSNGQDREIYQGRNAHCIWAVREPKLFCVEYEYKAGKLEVKLISLALDSGEVKPLHTLSGERVWMVSQTPDGDALYLGSVEDPSRATKLFRWETATGIETIIEQSPAGVNMPWVSPDARNLVWARPQGFDTRPLAGGTWKPVVSLQAGVVIRRSKMGITLGNTRFAITPEGNSLLYQDIDSAGKPGLFRVPLEGGISERVGDFPSRRFDGRIIISRDGRQIISETLDAAANLEAWSLRNFIPPGSKN
jgi:WD40 repeat protein